jgi:methylated-DNA-[protein]-cysteine S-methyltransferase
MMMQTKQHASAGSRHAFTTIATPVGTLTLMATAAGLSAVLWENERPDRVRISGDDEAPAHPVLVLAARELREYFDGTRRTFSVPLDVEGTAFQQRVWEALRTIPFGETRSYAQIARQIGQPDAVRAVGAANGRNPVSIITPCHRVIGATGRLTGFAAGLAVKARLLAHEGVTSPTFLAG